VIRPTINLGHERAPVEDAQRAIAAMHLDGLTDQPEWHRVAIGVKADQPVVRDAENRRERRPLGGGAQLPASVGTSAVSALAARLARNPSMNRSKWLTHAIRNARRWAWLGLLLALLGLIPCTVRAEEDSWSDSRAFGLTDEATTNDAASGPAQSVGARS
jgi:hypothetical protein